MNYEDEVIIISILVLLILCVGSPDLLDAIIFNLMEK